MKPPAPRQNKEELQKPQGCQKLFLELNQNLLPEIKRYLGF